MSYFSFGYPKRNNFFFIEEDILRNGNGNEKSFPLSLPECQDKKNPDLYYCDIFVVLVREGLDVW